MNIVNHILAFDLPGAPMLMLLGVLVAVAVVMRLGVRRRKDASRIDSQTSRHAERHNARLESQARDDINELMVRLEELSREICGQIDTRYAKLEHVLAESEKTLSALRAALQQQSALPRSASSPTPPPADPRHAEIFRLAQSGKTTLEIARELAMTVGEVELVLSLERSRLSLLPPADDCGS